MDKSVVISISGMQFEVEDDNAIEVITTGDYYYKNEKHYVIYDEFLDGTEDVTKNTIHFNDKVFELKRKGAVNVHMVFDINNKTMSNYATPFGNLVIGIDTSDIKITQSEDSVSAEVSYALDINYEYLTDCKLKLNIRSNKS